MFRKKYRLSAISFLLILSLFITISSYARVNEKPKEALKIVKAKELPVVGTTENLKKLLEMSYQYGNSGAINDSAIFAKPVSKGNIMITATSKAAAQENSKSDSSSTDFSKTNVQVEGVDEGDIVKTDGKYIYQVNNQKIIIVRAEPANAMTITSRISFENQSFNPTEVYVDDSYLVVIGMANNSDINQVDGMKRPIMLQQSVRAIIYNIANKNIIKKVREIDLDGNYVSSRKIGSKLYIIVNKYVYYYPSGNGILTPYYKDSALSKNYIDIKCKDIHYFPNSIEANYMMIGVFDTHNNDKGIKISTYLGSGQNLYMSMNNLYVAVGKYDSKELQPLIKAQIAPIAKGTTKVPVDSKVKSSGSIQVKPSIAVKPAIRTGNGIWWPGSAARDTLVYKFAVTKDSIRFIQSGEVPGTILNQFSMDENGDYFRIATTKGYVGATDENISKNNLYILNMDMKIQGKIENIAPGEKIYSVRFLGNRAYIVTFKNVDPLFVIDLKDSKNPKILGALKIPGFSDYLHPYDENHIIGFGKETIELPYKDAEGKVLGSTAYYLGMKIAIFDVTDVTKPKESGREIIGDRGTYSELLNDHRALLFSKEKNLLAFPITVFKLNDNQKVVNDQMGNSFPEYGSFDFQGAYVYSIDINKGFTLKGKITHLGSEEYLKSGMNNSDYTKNISRILYINNNLYTTSLNMIKATGIEDMKEKGNVEIK